METLEQGSLWAATAPKTKFGALKDDISVDVAIVGGGIAGMLAAAEIATGGRTVAVIEASRVGEGVTGHTTGKVTALQGAIYRALTKNFDAKRAAMYAEANKRGSALIDSLIAQHGLACEWRTKPAYTFALREEDRRIVQDEFAAASGAGLPVEWLDRVDELPLPTYGAVRLKDQAEFNAMSFVKKLARKLNGEPSVQIYERTRVTGMRRVEKRVFLTTDNMHEISAGKVVVASHFPFADRSMMFARMSSMRSYCVACEVPDPPPQGMHISVGGETYSLRSAPSPQGKGELLIVGGAGHRAGEQPQQDPYDKLLGFAYHHFGATVASYRWSAQDNMTLDDAPYVGPLVPGSDDSLVVTGFGKWGLSNSGAAALMLADLVAGRKQRWHEIYNSTRVNPRASALPFAEHNARAGWHFVKDRALHHSHPTCTHLGCKLNWNDVERTWDCPCHGSRFSEAGTVLEGPAVHDLPEVPATPATVEDVPSA